MKEDNSYKIGKAVEGEKGVYHNQEGNEVIGDIVYKRKAIYKEIECNNNK